MKACKMLYISIFRRSPLKMVGVYLARITFRCKNAEKYFEVSYHSLLPLQYPK